MPGRTEKERLGNGGRVGPGRPKNSEGADSRRDLLEAAWKVFGAKGYDGASIEEIVTLAGVSYPTLYHHFGNKAGLYTAAAFQAYGEVLAQFAARAAKAPDARSKIQAAIDTGVDIARRDPTLAMFFHDLSVEIRRHPELTTGREGVLHFRDALQSVIAEGVAEGSFPRYSDPQLLTQLVALLLSGLQSAALTMPAVEFRDLAQHVRGFFDENGALVVD